MPPPETPTSISIHAAYEGSDVENDEGERAWVFISIHAAYEGSDLIARSVEL